ncbi:hypothetical protein GJ744_007737 [Endocarpon pusillum]|uniref:Uncharacterized protein n=1 Tax=Endocarpon pusillum TaxID=364733 RepID=A0A8H7EBE0_9EURO|nr:hypothetical protein GJ744_007737 [Endocarpon pusillum]
MPKLGTSPSLSDLPNKEPPELSAAEANSRAPKAPERKTEKSIQQLLSTSKRTQTQELIHWPPAIHQIVKHSRDDQRPILDYLSSVVQCGKAEKKTENPANVHHMKKQDKTEKQSEKRKQDGMKKQAGETKQEGKNEMPERLAAAMARRKHWILPRAS